jgi:serine/threonine protein kinase
MLSAAAVEDALNRPPGRRAFHPSVREQLAPLNWGELLRSNESYLHIAQGGFALVYRVRGTDGREYALRCLTGTAERYAEKRAGQFRSFRQNTLPAIKAFVDQAFFLEGLQVDGVYHPIFVLDWVAGVDLLEGTRIRLKDSAALLALADKLQAMINQMQTVGMAHGDLHHENVLITPEGDLRLVDYDSVFVPGMLGLPCPILGVPGYAHPDFIGKKAERPFNHLMDTFTGLILLVSLESLAKDPSLFQRFARERLVFGGDDLAAPEFSKAFAEILTIPDPKLKHMAQTLQEMCFNRSKAERPLTEIMTACVSLPAKPLSHIRVPTLPEPPQRWIQPAISADDPLSQWLPYTNENRPR